MLPVQDGGKPHDLGLERLGAFRHREFKAFDHVFKHTVEAVQAGNAERNQQARFCQLILAVLIGLGQTHGRNAHCQCPSLWARSMVALSLVIRSLLTINAAP